MPAWVRKSWPVLKAALATAILVVIARRVAVDLRSNPDLWQRSPNAAWLAASAGLYLLGIGCSGLLWYRLLGTLGQRPTFLEAARASFVSQLGKYLPGKAWALLLRVALVRGPRVRARAAGISAFYEVLTTMAAGVLLAACLLALQGPSMSAAFNREAVQRLLTLQQPEDLASSQEGMLLLSLLLLAAVGIPILPPVFNRLIRRLPFGRGAASLAGDDEPKELGQPLGLRTINLVEGLALTSCGWVLIGGSFLVLLHAMFPAVPWDWATWSRSTAFVALAYVAGFVIILVPGGLGVREFFLTLFLLPELSRWAGAEAGEARAGAFLLVVLLRLVWTGAEVLAAGLFYWLPVATKFE